MLCPPASASPAPRSSPGSRDPRGPRGPRLSHARTYETPAHASQWTQGVPIEVAPFAYAKVLTNLADMGSPATLSSGKPGLTLRMGKMKAGPVVSDNGMFIIDAPFPPELMAKPEEVGQTVT